MGYLMSLRSFDIAKPFCAGVGRCLQYICRHKQASDILYIIDLHGVAVGILS